MPTMAATPAPASPLMTIDQVATEYGFALNTLRYWRQNSNGPHSVRIGRRVYYRRADVETWIMAQFD